MVDVEQQQTAHERAVELRGATKKQLLAEGVFNLIGERIVSGELAAGTRIRDGELAAELDVSRTPVREALQRLERIGLVTMFPSRYTEVSHITPEIVEASHAFAGYQAGIIARLACRRLAPDELSALSELIANIAATVDDPAACSQARREAIGYLAARCGNVLQQALVDEASMALARNLRELAISPEHRGQLLTGCIDVEDALRRGDADAAEQACRAIYGID